MADISATKLPLKRLPNTLVSLYETRSYDITPVTDGVYGAAAQTLVSIPVGKALVGGGIVFITDMDSGTDSATMTFTCNSVALTGAISIGAGSAAGAYVAFPMNAVGATAGLSFYAKTAAITVIMTVGAEALTAGRFILMLKLLDVTAITDNG